MNGWRHFFVFLRGEAEFAEGCARAERAQAADNDPAEQQKLIQARSALRAGEVGFGGAAADANSGP